MYTKILLYVYIIFVTSFVDSQVGNQCNLPITGKKGVCKVVNDCPSATKQATVGIRPVICGRQNNAPIVCCEGIATATSAPFVPIVPSVPLKLRPTASNHGLRISERKCMEYTTSVVSIEQAVPLSAHSSLISYETANCTYEGIPLIFGGQKAVLGEFPHMALLGYFSPIKWLCGGTLISDQFVLTAAHCLTTVQFGSVKVVRLAELSISQSEPNSEPEDFDIAQTYKHPDYQRPKVYNDIALIRLSRRVIFNSYKRPACLWSKFDIGTTSTIATGWGTTEEDPTSTSDDLLKVGLNIIDNNQCNNKYVDYFDRKLQGIQRNQICARNTTHLGDTCQGDSGGPIQVPKPNNRCVFYVVGVTSAGRWCGGELPGLYTRVSEYIDWIENIVWQ